MVGSFGLQTIVLVEHSFVKFDCIYMCLSMKVLPGFLSLPIIGCLCFSLIILQASFSKSTSFIFNGFDARNISLSGIAEMDGRLIRLTNTSNQAFGRAFYPYPIRIKDASTSVVSSFSSTFVFCITPLANNLGGNGVAFVMSPSLDSTGISASQYLGMLNVFMNGNSSNHIFGIEFDTALDVDMQDINNNHVGIDLNSMISTDSTEAGYWTLSQNASHNASKTVINLQSGDTIQAWIDYDGHRQQLNVSIAPTPQPRPHIPLLSVNGLNLSDVLEENTYVGISAATGALISTHRVLSWSFNSNGVAESLDLSKLPSIGPKTSTLATTKFKIPISIGGVVLLLILGSLVGLLLYKWSQREIVESWERGFGLHRYSYNELVIATRKFHEKELLGVGGFGRVYRGVLPQSGLEVAVKRLSRESHQGEREFITEMVSVGRLRHSNLVQLLGWSRHKGELLLVYEYLRNGSLDKLLFGNSNRALRWQQRTKILKGIAAGMLYLHEGWEQQILHRDIKSSNVLLDANMNAKLGDFGLAKLYEHGQNPQTTRVVGTLGYLAPEMARTGRATTSTDVYSFGALLLEVVTGRRTIEDSGGSAEQAPFLLLEEVWELYRNERLLDAVDRKLEGLFDAEEVEKLLTLGLLCSHVDSQARPSMRQVVEMLRNEAPLPPLQPRPAFCVNLPSQRRLRADLGEFISFSSSSVKAWNPLDAWSNVSPR